MWGQTTKARRATLRIHLSSKEFVEGEPIYLQVERSEGPEVGYNDRLEVDLKDENGDLAVYPVARGAELVSLFGKHVPGGGFGWKLAPGRYRVWVHSPDEHSDTLAFEVRPAAGDNAKALHLLELGLRARFVDPEGIKLGIKQGQDREFWRKIVDDYPVSVCAPVALSLLIDARWIGPRIWTPVQEVISDCKRMLEEYPHFYRAHHYVREIAGLYRQIGKSEEAKVYLQRQVAENLNPRTVEEARQVLDNWME